MAEPPRQFDDARARVIRELVTAWISSPKLPVNAIPASPDDVVWLLDELAEARRRMHHILDTIYSTHGYLDAEGEIDTPAKFRAIERLARLDWDAEGLPRV